MKNRRSSQMCSKIIEPPSPRARDYHQTYYYHAHNQCPTMTDRPPSPSTPATGPATTSRWRR